MILQAALVIFFSTATYAHYSQIEEYCILKGIKRTLKAD